MWQWWNYALASVPVGFRILRLNLDETSVRLFQGDGKGTVFFQKRKRKRSSGPDEEGHGEEDDSGRGEEPVQFANLQLKRTCLTHVGIVCDRSEIQPLLPQVLIGNESTFKAEEMARLSAACPRNVILLRQRSAWNNAETQKHVFRLLAAALREHERTAICPPMKRWQPVLLLDACRLHFHPSVARSAASLGIPLVFVPARLTWLLQPLDTHVFQRYKEYFRSAYQRARLQTPDGKLAVSQFLDVFVETIRRVLQGVRWQVAFDSDGYDHHGQGQVSTYILEQLEVPKAPEVPSLEPTREMLQLCFPRNSTVPFATLMSLHRPQLALPAPPQGQAAPQLGLPGPAPPIGRFARGALLAPKRPALPAPPASEPSRPLTRLQAALQAGPSASGSASSSSRPAKARRGL